MAMSGIGYRFYSGHFRGGVYFRWILVGVVIGVFLGCLFLGVPPIYFAFCLYSQRSGCLIKFVVKKKL